MTNKFINLNDTVFGIIITVILFLLAVIPAGAGIYDGSEELYRSRVIDHAITPERVEIVENRIINSGGTDQASIDKLNRFSQNTIFWTGRIEKYLIYPNNYWLLVRPEKGRRFWVFAKKNVRNLDFDRAGYLVGVKGSLIFRDNRLYYLKAKSVVLIAPAEALAYRNFMERYHIPTTCEMNTTLGRVSLSNKYYPFILHRIYMHNPHYPWKTIQSIGAAIIYYTDKYPMDPLLATALFNVESAFDVDAVSPSGAIGLGQLMPGTAAGLGINPDDPIQNIGGSIKYFYRQLQLWRGYSDQIDLALASYNAGPGAVSSYGGIPPYSETKNYVFFIKFLYGEYKKQFNGEY